MILELTDTNISKHIQKKFIGLYHLGFLIEGVFVIKYIGRSDTILRRRLKQHFKSKTYTHFIFFPTETILEAYLLECREWHRFDDLDNKIHPDSPKQLPYKCPYCNIHTEFQIDKK